jgi:hypothetical protein
VNLREFIRHGEICPICSAKTSFSFHSKRRQSFRYEEDRLIVLFPLEAIKKGQSDYKVGYSFGLDDDSLRIEFYSKDEKRMDDRTPMFLIDRFRELNKNLGIYTWVKSCPCERYGCTSQSFSLDRVDSIPSIELSNEFWTFSYNGKFIDMVNLYATRQTAVVCRKNYDDIGSSFNIPLIPFISLEETSARLQNLIPFS